MPFESEGKTISLRSDCDSATVRAGGTVSFICSILNGTCAAIRYTSCSEVCMTVHIPADIEDQIEAFANRTGESKDDLVRQALLGYLEDRRDAMIAAERLKTANGRINLEEIGRKYGLAG